MSYDYNQTHENILKSARKQFAEKGFRDASIRKICSDAGVTNGAFYSHFKSKEDLLGSIISPRIKALTDLYSSEKELFLDIKSPDDILNAFKKSYSSYSKAIIYVCGYREEFLLLIDSCEGSEYDGFLDMLIDEETENTMEFLSRSKRFIKNPENVTENIARLGASFMIETIFDGLKNGLSADEIIKETAVVSEYCIAGYRHMLGI